MKKELFVLSINFVGFICITKNVAAYLDPGTGGAIVGTIWPLMLALFSAIGVLLMKYFWNPIKKKVSKLRIGKKRD